MWLSELTLNRASREVIRDLADCRELHRTVMRAFPDADSTTGRHDHGVLFRLNGGDPPTLLVQSSTRPDWSFHTDGYATVRGPKALPFDDETFAAGTALRFLLVANPVKRRDGKRWALTGDDERLGWLDRQGERGGFRVIAASVADQGEIAGRKGPHRVLHRAARFEGQLEVTDSTAFAASLRHGIGPGRAHGLGLLSVRA